MLSSRFGHLNKVVPLLKANAEGTSFVLLLETSIP